MENITNFLKWWYEGNGLIYSFILTMGPVLIFGLYSAWKLEDIDMDSTCSLFLMSIFGSGALFILFPIVSIIGTLYLILFAVNKSGKKYRKIKKSKETRQAEALAYLLKNDPELLDRYNKLMEESEKLLEDL